MRTRIIAAAVAFYSAAAAPPSLSPSLAQSLPPAVQAQVAKGKLIFETTCSSSTCHGSGGAGGQAPKLQDRALTLEAIRETILNGRSGTAMPPFKDVLYPDMQVDVMAFVLSIASGGRLPTTVIAANQGSTAAPPPPKTEPIAVGAERGTPSVGAALFFDATRLAGCRTCHSHNKAGGPLGPDFAGTQKMPADILASITAANVSAPGYVSLSLALKDGTRIMGIKRDENAEVLRLYDISAIPPVARTILKSDIATTTIIANAGIFDHGPLPYSRQERVDIAAFLGKP